MRLRVKWLLSLAGLLSLLSCGGGGGTIAPPNPPPPPPPPVGAPDIAEQRVFTNLDFAQPVSMVQAPGDPTRWFVVERNGFVRVFDNNQNVAEADVNVFVNIATLVDSGFDESGLLGIAFHPGFPGTPEVFLSYTAPGSPLISYVSRFRSLDGGSTLDPSPEIILTVIQDNINHNGGDLAFGFDGNLYASFGDGGGAGDLNGNAQNTANLLGSILRVNIDGNTPYEIPAENPFASPNLCLQGSSSGGSCPEIYAYGLRNPWRMSFDSATGDLWVGDVGQGDWEEADRVEVGRNYGWNVREGANCYPPGSACSTTGLEDPVTEYGRGLGRSITGGYVYRGSGIAELAGWYVFGDFASGRLFAVPADSEPTVTPEELLDTALSISTFAEDIDGELYVIDYGTGTIHQIVAAP